MQLDLTGKHALVCGASEGIGRATAIELAQLGADVTVLARREPALREVIATLPRHGSQRHGFITTDIADTDALRTATNALAAERPVHVLVNNSGGPPGGRAIDADIDAFLAAYRQHLIANQTLAQALTPGMREAGYGRIVNVISTSVYEPIPNLGVSNTTRAAVAGWAKTLSKELAADGITVNNVLPGFTETGRIAQIVRDQMAQSGKPENEVRAAMRALIPAQRFADPAEVASVIVFLCTPAAAYVSGQSIAVDGGRMNSI
ncbi:SDR family oxidoreductase [Lysobacter pythonis]|uniref:SDR family oxidoreductase n=1 Tax=Solilutibacter pythonis TaxID=2483112 RepID=A0A3M2I9M2_9GAMM|nr:SDR family oxidoreductase [Lysobacter pythonis]RMH94994.1 SDR family oxidoreductase [Lysobacter pythonis]